MARATKVAWMGMAMGLALTPMQLSAQQLGTATESLAVAGQKAPAPAPTPAQAHMAFRNAMDSYRKGDYDAAASWLAQAKAGEASLSVAERGELPTWENLNKKALDHRKAGIDQIRHAEEAMKLGRTQDAVAWLKAATPNHQYLADADKQKMKQLSDRVMPGSLKQVAATAPKDNKLAEAKDKLAKARQLMAKGSYEAAETMAIQADSLKVVWPTGEDNPAKVRNDIVSARMKEGSLSTDPKALLVSARVAMGKGDFDTAERLAHQAEKHSSFMSSLTWYGDTPAKVLKEIQAGRAAAAQKSVATKSSPVRGPDNMLPAPGKLAAANPLTNDTTSQAKPLANSNTTQAKPVPAGTTQTKQDTASTDPRALLKQAHELFHQGKYAEAEKVAHRADQYARTVSWGYFEETPEKLLNDIQKAKTKQAQEESVRVLAHARKAYERGNLDEAENLAYKALKLHGPYSMLDLGDRPQKLVAEVQAAREKNRTVKVPGTQVAQSKTTDTGSNKASTTTAAKSPATSSLTMEGVEKKHKATACLAEAHRLEREGRLLEARQKAMEAKQMGVSYSGNEERPESVLLTLDATCKRKIDSLVALANQHLTSSASDLRMALQAHEELMQAKQLAVGFALETRQIDDKLAQAQRKTVTVAGQPAANSSVNVPSLSPVNVPAPRATQTVASSPVSGMNQPTYTSPTGVPVPVLPVIVSGPKTSQPVVSSPMPASTQPSYTAQSTAPAPVAPAIPAPTAWQNPNNTTISASIQAQAPVATTSEGRELLDKARLELRAGQTANARRLAEEAYSPKMGVQPEAAQVLQLIDREEFNQKAVTAQKTFDAAESAFKRREYAQSAAMFRSIELKLLPVDKQARVREFLQSDLMAGPAVVPTARWQESPATSRVTAPAEQAVTPKAPAVQAPATVATMESQGSSYLSQAAAMEEVKYQKLRMDGLNVISEATNRFKAGDTNRAMEMIEEHLARIQAAGLVQDKAAQLKKPLEDRLATLKLLRHNKDFQTAQDNDRKSFDKKMAKDFESEKEKQKQLTDLMKQYQALYKEKKYRDAEMIACRMQELDPEDPRFSAAVYDARMSGNHKDYQDILAKREKTFRENMNAAEDTGVVVGEKQPVSYDKERTQENRVRTATSQQLGKRQTDADRHILQRVNHDKVQPVDWKDTPLRQVVDDLRSWTNLNIVVDQQALKEANISLDLPINMKLTEPIVLKSALNLLLREAHLSYEVRDEVLYITTEDNARGKMEVRIHPVADLVIPIQDSTSPGGVLGTTNLRAAAASILGNPNEGKELQLNSNAPMGGRWGSQAAPWLDPQNPAQARMTSMPSGGSMTSTPTTEKSNPKGTIEDVLIKLIQSTIAPGSWDTVGGQGHIEFFPIGMALTISQTPDIQEQVQDLLAALRRLQDQEVAVEVKFISLAEAYFERIGVDFNVNLTNHNNAKYGPQIVSQQFAPFGFLNNFQPTKLISGMTPAGNLTQDLNIPINTSSFAMATPPFGAYPNIPGGNGGVDLGIAFLSDIQVFMFMEAAQGDQRTNVMQAPKLTLFNGQSATISIFDTQFFVTSVQVAQLGGQVIFVPQNSPIPTGGVTMTIQAVISADRRYVRLSLTPNLTNIASANIPLYPITTFITPVFEGGAVGQPIPFTQFLQQPAFNTITVQTTVNVPDGGTVLLGGLKRLSEGRNEFGPPILSNIPYIDRLFRNVGYGRETTSLLMMVTPRIIINEEEEARQVPGVVSQLGGTQQNQ